MFGKRLRRQEKGQVILAKTLNDAIDAAERGGQIHVAAPLQSRSTSAGLTVAHVGPRVFFAKITSGSGTGPYAWIERIPGASGAFTDGFLSGTTSLNSAYNTLSGVTLALPVDGVLMRWTVAGDIRFTAGAC